MCSVHSRSETTLGITWDFRLTLKRHIKGYAYVKKNMAFSDLRCKISLYFYRVAPFGATFSASWWSRLGGWMLRFFHFLLWWAHVALLYVDDYLFHQSIFGMPISAAMICLICQIVNIPVSWQKCELAFSIQWIGWKIHFRSGFIEIPLTKIDKFLGYLHSMGRSSRTSKRNLEKLIGLALWLTQLWPYMRIWIRHWYHDLYSIPATHYSIDNGDWRQFSRSFR